MLSGKTAFFFGTLELWTLEAEIRAGLYPELAPFLLLWEEEPTEETLVLLGTQAVGARKMPMIRVTLRRFRSISRGEK